MIRVEGIDHVALTVRDVGRSIAWYQTVLGLERRHADVWGDFPAVLGTGTTSLALFPAPVQDPAPPPGREVLSVRHIAFRVDRAAFEGARAELESLGLTPRFEDHTAAHSLYFTDPDGHQLEITPTRSARAERFAGAVSRSTRSSQRRCLLTMRSPISASASVVVGASARTTSSMR